VSNKTVTNLTSYRLNVLTTSNNVTAHSPFTTHHSLKQRAAFTLAEVFSPHFKDNRKIAFTLAEVLITLGIIGVVAAMTLPTLIQKHQEQVTVSKLKKMNSVLSNAFLLAVEEYGAPDTWGFSRSPGSTDDEEAIAKYANGVDSVMNKLLPFLKTSYVCYQSDKSCKNLDKYTRDRHNLNGQLLGKFSTPRIILADGASIDVIYFASNTCNQIYGTTKTLKNGCGEILVDINGINPPNAQGKDVFFFYLTKYGIVPAGSGFASLHTFDGQCNMGKPTYRNGYGCTAWVIYNENMDYLHCDDLSWNGKKKCK